MILGFWDSNHLVPIRTRNSKNESAKAWLYRAHHYSSFSSVNTFDSNLIVCKSHLRGLASHTIYWNANYRANSTKHTTKCTSSPPRHIFLTRIKLRVCPTLSISSGYPRPLGGERRTKCVPVCLPDSRSGMPPVTTSSRAGHILPDVCTSLKLCKEPSCVLIMGHSLCTGGSQIFFSFEQRKRRSGFGCFFRDVLGGFLF